MINCGILGLGKMGTTFANSIEETSNSKIISIASKSGKTFKDFEIQKTHPLKILFYQIFAHRYFCKKRGSDARIFKEIIK